MFTREDYVLTVVVSGIIIIVIIVAAGCLYIRGGCDIPACSHACPTLWSITPDDVTTTAPEVRLSGAGHGRVTTPRDGSLPVIQKRCLGHASDSPDLTSFKTGDLLFVSYKGVRSLFSRIAYNSAWTHVGIVWIDPATSEPYVLEGSVYRPPYVARMVRVPLLYWFRVNRSAAFLMRLAINKSIDADSLSAAFREFETADVGVESLRHQWLRFLTRRKAADLPPENFFADAAVRRTPATKSYVSMNPLRDGLEALGIWSPDENKQFDYVLTCHEIVIGCLQKTGVLDATYSPDSYLPSCLARRAIPTINGFEFAPGKLFSLDEMHETAMVQ